MKKKNLLIIGPQLGTGVDFYKYCEHLNNKYNIKYLCFDNGFEKINIPNVKTIYISYKGNKFIRGIRFLFNAVMVSLFHHGVVFIANGFKGAEVLTYFKPKSKLIYDIRSIGVVGDEKQRESYNNYLKRVATKFDKITIISQGAVGKLNLPIKKCHILPLGSDIISRSDKRFDSIKLLYVGTLTGREIDKTIDGFKKFYSQFQDKYTITYDIVGDGHNNELEEIKCKIKNFFLEEIITTHGRIDHFLLKPYFEKCNIGVSFVPKKKFFEHQPPTKTFEYILSGMICIATSTKSNCKLINHENGILIDDTAESFYEALVNYTENMSKYNSNSIRNTLIIHQWQNVIDTHLVPVIESCFK